jgi:hypothetical protein
MTQAFNLSQLANGVNTSGQLNIATYVTGTLPSANLPTVPVDKGGTGQTTYTNGQLLIGNTTGNTLTKTTLTAGTNITITNGAGSITIDAAGGSPTTAQVLSATAGASLGAVGTYACVRAETSASPGSTASAAVMQWANTNGDFTGTPSGTWRVMGQTINNGVQRTSVWLRIS